MAIQIYRLQDSLPDGAVMVRASTSYGAVEPDGLLVVHGVGIPVFEYSSSLLGRAYRSEPGYVNLFAAPEDFSDPVWIHQQVPGDVSVDVDASVSPDGRVTADLLNILNPVSSDVGITQYDAPLVNGDKYMTAIYVQLDTSPADFAIKNPNGAGLIGAVLGVATADWQRIQRLDTVTGTVSGLYFRKNAGVGGNFRLWGAVRYSDQGGKLFSYHPDTKAADYLSVPNGILDGAEGTVGIEWVPGFAAADEQGLSESVMLDLSGPDFRLAWAGDDVPSYIRLYNDGSSIAQVNTRHDAGTPMRLRVHYGGEPTRPHLEVNGWMMRASAAWVAPVIPPDASVGCDNAGINQCFGLYRNMIVETTRRVPDRRFASLGDSISTEPYGSDTRSWNRRAGEVYLEPDGRQILVAGVGGNTFALLLARLQSDVVDQQITDCVVLCGVNDIVTNRTLLEMQTDATAVYDALKTAGIRVIACTILPFKGAASWSAPREVIRDGFNAWLLAGRPDVDLVVDTAAHLRSPVDEESLAPAYDSGDFVHPSDAGSDALADVIMQAALADPAFLLLDDGSRVAQGSVDGGTAVTIVGDGGFVDDSCDDDFSGVVIDPTKWSTFEVGSGAVTQDDGLTLRTGVVVSSSAALTSLQAFEPVVDLSFFFTIETDVVSFPPSETVRFLDVELQIDANNYWRASRLFDPTFGHGFHFTAVVGGVTVDEIILQDQSATSGVIRLTRVGGRVRFCLNGNVLYDDNPFVQQGARLVLRAVNESASVAYDVWTFLEEFDVGTVVLFGQQPGSVVRIGDTYVRVLTPASDIPRTVPVEIWTCEGLVERVNDAFEYLPAQQFVVMDASGVTIGILGDGTLRNAGGSGFEVT